MHDVCTAYKYPIDFHILFYIETDGRFKYSTITNKNYHLG